jgi:hypothetical protein
VHALRAPLKNLNSNWAYMVVVSLAWSMKAWFATGMKFANAALKLRGAAIIKRLLTMEQRTVLQIIVNTPCVVAKTARRILLQPIVTTPWSQILLESSLLRRA